MPNRTYVKFQALQRGKNASFISHYIQSNSMSLARFRQLYEARPDFIGTTKEMWEETYNRNPYSDSLARISDTLLRVVPDEGSEVGPTSEPDR